MRKSCVAAIGSSQLTNTKVILTLCMQACLDDPSAAAVALTQAPEAYVESTYPLLLASLQDGCLEAAQLLLLLTAQLARNKTRQRLPATPCTPLAGIDPGGSDACQQRLVWPPMVLNRLALLATAAPAADGSGNSDGALRAGEAARLETTQSLRNVSRCTLGYALFSCWSRVWP